MIRVHTAEQFNSISKNKDKKITTKSKRKKKKKGAHITPVLLLAFSSSPSTFYSSFHLPWPFDFIIFYNLTPGQLRGNTCVLYARLHSPIIIAPLTRKDKLLKIEVFFFWVLCFVSSSFFDFFYSPAANSVSSNWSSPFS
jgi:hypothetical protein